MFNTFLLLLPFFFERGHTSAPPKYGRYLPYFQSQLHWKPKITSLTSLGSGYGTWLGSANQMCLCDVDSKAGGPYEVYLLVRKAAEVICLGSTSGRGSGSEARVLSVLESTPVGSAKHFIGADLLCDLKHCPGCQRLCLTPSQTPISFINSYPNWID